MRLATRLTAGLATAITVCWALALAISGSTDVFFYLAPALLIIAPLVAGRYPGEKLILELATRSRRRRHWTAPSRPAPKAPAIWLPRGNRLIAFSLAERPPPALLLPQT
jgi:hypothetical protein